MHDFEILMLHIVVVFVIKPEIYCPILVAT